MLGLNSLNRRQFVSRLAWGIAATAQPRLSWADTEPASPLVKRVVKTPPNTFFTYPHSNGYLPDGRFVIASPADNGVDYLAFQPETGETVKLIHIPGAHPYYSISSRGLMLLTKKENAVVIDLTEPKPTPKSIFNLPEWALAIDCDISADGRTALLTSSHYVTPAEHRLDSVDIASGTSRTIMKTDWLMDHGHFSPFDQTWISFCDGEEAHLRRMWLWNERSAPQARHVFEQNQPDGTFFDIGHERAMFHKPALLVIAYGGHGAAKPRGLYEVGCDGSVRLISQSNQDFHCNISRDGRWAVVSLQGTYDPTTERPRGDWQKTNGDYGFSDVMVVNMQNGARQFLYRGTNAAAGQPYEVQPAISPDGRWVLLKDAREKAVLALEVDLPKLDKFLS